MSFLRYHLLTGYALLVFGYLLLPIAVIVLLRRSASAPVACQALGVAS